MPDAFDTLQSASRKVPLKATRGATRLYVTPMGLVAQGKINQPSKLTPGNFSIQAVEDAERLTRPKGRRNGRPVFFRLF